MYKGAGNPLTRQKGQTMNDFVINTLHNRKHQPVYTVNVYMNDSGSVTAPLFPGKVFKTYEEARTAAMDKLQLWLPFN